MAEKKTKRESILSRAAIRLCIIAGIAGFIVSALLILLPQESLTTHCSRLALAIGDSQRMASADPGRLESELGAVVGKSKIVLPTVSFLILLWGCLWSYFLKRAHQPSVAFEPEPERAPGVNIFLLAGIIILAAVLRCININQSLWFDEVYSVLNYIDKGSFIHLLTTYKYFNNHILYSVFARISMLVFGRYEWAFRLPSLVFGFAGIWAIVKLAGLLKSRSIMLVSAVLLVFSPLHIDQSQQARGYTALVLCAILSSYFFLRAIKEDKNNLWLGFMAATILGLYSHLYMLALFLSQFMVILWYGCLKKEKGSVLISPSVANNFFLYSSLGLAGAFLLYLPVLPYIVFELFRHTAKKGVNFEFIWLVFKAIGSGYQGLDKGILYFLLFITGAFCLWKKEKPLVMLAVFSFIIPLAFNLLVRPRYIYARFFIFILPVYLICIAAALDELGKRVFLKKRHIAVFMAVAVLIATSFPASYTILARDRQNYREAAAFIRKISDDNTNTVIIAPGSAGAEVKYYLHDYPVVKISSIKDIGELDKRYSQLIFFITYKGTISEELLSFIADNYELTASYNSRGPVEVYLGKKQ
jgi:uncharacterized membrane protein